MSPGKPKIQWIIHLIMLSFMILLPMVSVAQQTRRPDSYYSRNDLRAAKPDPQPASLSHQQEAAQNQVVDRYQQMVSQNRLRSKNPIQGLRPTMNEIRPASIPGRVENQDQRFHGRRLNSTNHSNPFRSNQNSANPSATNVQPPPVQANQYTLSLHDALPIYRKSVV